MTWRDAPHVCEAPLKIYSLSVVRHYWECDYCKRLWTLVRVSDADQHGVFHLTMESRVGDRITTLTSHA